MKGVAGRSKPGVCRVVLAVAVGLISGIGALTLYPSARAAHRVAIAPTVSVQQFAVGTFLLSLPIAVQGRSATFMEALFTATSAICVTGLSTVDTPNYWTPFGQVVILVLVHILEVLILLIIFFNWLLLFLFFCTLRTPGTNLYRRGVEPAAHHFGLDFIPIVDEDYYFACDRARLERAPLSTVIGLLRGAVFRHSVDQLEGYDPRDCGKLLDLETGLGPMAL